MMTTEGVELFYNNMQTIVKKYNEWARSENPGMPRRWLIMGIEAWLDDFEVRIKQEPVEKREPFVNNLLLQKLELRDTLEKTKIYGDKK